MKLKEKQDATNYKTIILKGVKATEMYKNIKKGHLLFIYMVECD